MADRRAQFWAICATLTDFELCSRMAIAAESSSDESRPWPHIIVDRLWSFHGFTESAGLEASAVSCFFEGESLRPIAEAYDVIGLPANAAVVWNLAAIIDEANTENASLFQEAEDFVSFLSERIELNECEDVFFDGETGIVEHLAKFIRSKIGAFENLDIDFSPPQWDPPNTGYLKSMQMWVHDFAVENNGGVPTLSELRNFCRHDGIKCLTSKTHTILVEGRLPDDITKPLIRYHREGAHKSYVVTVGGMIIGEPRGG